MTKPRARHTHPQLPKARRALQRITARNKQLDKELDQRTLSMLLAGVEFGFVRRETGHNLTSTLREAIALWPKK